MNWRETLTDLSFTEPEPMDDDELAMTLLAATIIRKRLTVLAEAASKRLQEGGNQCKCDRCTLKRALMDGDMEAAQNAVGRLFGGDAAVFSARLKPHVHARDEQEQDRGA